MNQLTKAQFFTKSSKSIPRMGRRSDESMVTNIQSRRALIDNLIDEFGPTNLLAALEAKTNNQAGSSIVVEGSSEVAFKNDQPFDINPNSPYLSQQTTEYGDVLYPYSTDSFSSNADEHGLTYLVRRSNNNNNQLLDGSSNSLAMRALNTERYLRHLASGQPLSALNHAITMNQKQHQQQQQQQQQKQHENLFKEGQRV